MDKIQLQKDINEVINKYCSSISLKGIGFDYSEYGRPYYFTNEHLAELYNRINTSKYQNGLCVLSSGDHALNMIYKGIEQVDTFDSSRLTEYYALGIKKTAVEVLKYQEFLNLFSNNFFRNENQLSLEKYVLSCISKEYKNFWDSFLNARKILGDEKPTVFKLCRDIEIIRGTNLYLQSEKEYNKLKENLRHAKITYNNADIRELPTKFGTYDLIVLSNIINVLDCCDNPNIIHNMIKNIYTYNLKLKGEIIYDYKYMEDTIIYDEYYLAINYAPKRIRRLRGDEVACLKK